MTFLGWLKMGQAIYEYLDEQFSKNKDNLTPEERAAYEADLKSRFDAARQRLRDAQNP